MTKLKKKYFFSIIEEAILSPDKKYAGLRGGRIEIWDNYSPYSIEEIRITLPADIWEALVEALDFKEVDYFQIGSYSSEQLDKREAALKRMKI